MRRLALAFAIAVTLAACSSSQEWVEASADWFPRSIDRAQIVVVVQVGSSTCDRFNRLDVAETSDEVRIIAVIETLVFRGQEGFCTADNVSVTATAELSEPLGARLLTGCRAANPDVSTC